MMQHKINFIYKYKYNSFLIDLPKKKKKCKKSKIYIILKYFIIFYLMQPSIVKIKIFNF